MNQETRINKIINESLQAFEHLCLENDLNRVRTGRMSLSARISFQITISG
jgi:hypothetical protein